MPSQISNNNSANNKRIAKNTIMLYFRMILLMAVSLYTSRVILKTLGVNDFGIYNVVGGVVTMLSFFSGSLGGSISRFITFELGTENRDSLECTFRCCATIFYIFSIIAFVLAETIGLWFVQNKLNIPDTRRLAAFWVYQCSVISFIVSILSSSYNALIIAHEKMNAFAYISIYEAIAKLAIVYILLIQPFDKLIVYALLILLVQVSVRFIYTIYCKRHFTECNDKWLWDNNISKTILSYTGWTLSSGVAMIANTQGLNILLNLFFGPVVNASRAVSVQVQSVITQVFTNFQTAIRPQIIKNYANNNLQYMHDLMIEAGKFSFLLSFMITVPVACNSEYILKLWLEDVPEYSAEFVKWMLYGCCLNSLAQHAIMGIHATGNIKQFQITESICLLSVFPLAYVGLKFFNLPPVSVFVIYAIVEGLTNLVRVHVIYPKVHMKVVDFYTKIVLPLLLVTITTFTFIDLFHHFYNTHDILSLAWSILAEIIITAIAIYIFGLNTKEKLFFNSKVTSLFRRKR